MTEYFSLFRGCHQDDLFSPYIFYSMCRVLSHMIKNIKGIFINNEAFILSQYADDTQIFLDGSEMSLRKTLEKSNSFFIAEVSRVNFLQ